MGKKIAIKVMGKRSANLFAKISGLANKLLTGDLRISRIRLPKAMLIGILGVVFLYVSVAGLISITTPWYSPHGDTGPHVDYVWRLHNGDLPKYDQGITYPAFVERGANKSRQQAAVNPPLFYLVHALFVGRLLNEGEWHKAIAVGRAINIFIGVLLIASLAWAGWVFGGSRKALFAVAVPAVSALSYWILRLNRDYALDAFLAVFTSLTLVILYKIIQKGPKPRYMAGLIVLSICGMSTKAPYIIFLAVSLLAVVISVFMHSKATFNKKILKCVGLTALILGAVALVIGWFYYLWNYRSSGKWFSAFPNSQSGDREYKSFWDVTTSPLLWAIFYARYTAIPIFSAVISSFTIAGYFTMKKVNLLKLKKDKTSVYIILLMALAVTGVIATQLELAIGFGSINYRYLLPAILPIGLYLCYGLLEIKWLRGQLVAAAAIIMSGTTLLAIRVSPTKENLPPGITTWDEGIKKIYKIGLGYGVPASVVVALFAMFIVGAILLPIALYRLSYYKHKN